MDFGAGGGGVPCIYLYICIYIYIYIHGNPPPPPMYPRLSSQSRLWEGMGSWDALVPMAFSETSCRTAWVNGIGGVPVDTMFVPYLEVENSHRGPR